MEWVIDICQIALRKIYACANEQVKNAEILQHLMLEDLQRNIYHERERAAIMEMAVILQKRGMLDTLEAKIIMKVIKGGMQYDEFDCTR